MYDEKLSLAGKGVLTLLLEISKGEEPMERLGEFSSDGLPAIQESIQRLLTHDYLSLKTVWILGNEESELSMRTCPRGDRPST